MGELFIAVALIMCARWFFRSEMAEAVTASLRSKQAAPSSELIEQIQELSDRLEDELGRLRGEMVELTERVEFTERLLIDAKNRGVLPQGVSHTD